MFQPLKRLMLPDQTMLKHLLKVLDLTLEMIHYMRQVPIGGVEYGFSPLLMAAAYASFGNGGIYNEPSTIEKIVNK